jgi:hypothetical protein
MSLERDVAPVAPQPPGPAPTKTLPAGNPLPRDQDAAAWLAGYTAGWDAGARSQPTRPEVEAWCQEQVKRAYRAGYADGTAIGEHRQDARALTEAHRIATDRARSGYIPRRTVA